MVTAKPLPTDLDLWTIHRALLAAGFTQHRPSTAATDPNWVYTKPGDDLDFLGLPNPHLGLVGDGLHYTPELQRATAGQALDVLCALTGDPHLECGPRTDRERALVEALNATNNHA